MLAWDKKFEQKYFILEVLEFLDNIRKREMREGRDQALIIIKSGTLRGLV